VLCARWKSYLMSMYEHSYALETVRKSSYPARVARIYRCVPKVEPGASPLDWMASLLAIVHEAKMCYLPMSQFEVRGLAQLTVGDVVSGQPQYFCQATARFLLMNHTRTIFQSLEGDMAEWSKAPD
jgi:hypothetical protein